MSLKAKFNPAVTGKQRFVPQTTADMIIHRQQINEALLTQPIDLVASRYNERISTVHFIASKLFQTGSAK